MNTYIFIHGGEVFADQSEYRKFITSTLVDWNIEPLAIGEEKKKWKIELAKKLTEQGNQVYMPNFPNPLNAHYEEWKLFFEAWITKVEIVGTITFIGHSLGGNFLLKYFSENTDFSHTLNAIHLIAACIECGNFVPADNYKVLESLGSKVHIWHAEDDDIVPFATAKQLEKELPGAQTHFFGPKAGYGHFHGVERFPELESEIFKK